MKITKEEVFTVWRPEILSYLEDMLQFSQKDAREVLELLSAYSARVSWMRNFAARSALEDVRRFRIDEVDPFLEEVDRQFKIYSRLISANQFEFEMTR